jgi:hypothetical protein
MHSVQALLSTVEPEISGYLPLKVINIQKNKSILQICKEQVRKKIFTIGVDA